jgi:hypothetical protein
MMPSAFAIGDVVALDDPAASHPAGIAIGMSSDDATRILGSTNSKETGWYGDVQGEKWAFEQCDLIIANSDHTVREIRWHERAKPKAAAKPAKHAGRKKASTNPKPSRGSSSVDDDMRMLVRAGVLLNSNDTFDDFQVSPAKWALMPYDAKRGVVITVARFAKEKNGKGYVKLRDYMTGRLLASYDSWSGMKIAGADE